MRFAVRALAGVSIFLFFRTLWAEPFPYEGDRIARVVFNPAEQPLLPEELARRVALKANTSLHMADVRKTIKNLYASGRYEDIEIVTLPAAGSVTIEIVTKDRWFIGPVNVQGSIKRPASRGRLAEASQLELGKAFSNLKLESASESIRGALKDYGFYEAMVKAQMSHVEKAQQARIQFQVAPGQGARLSEPIVTGDPQVPAKRVIAATKWKPWYSFHWNIASQNNLNQGIQNLREEYVEQGRLMASISIPTVKYDAKSKQVIPTLRVVAGPKVIVRTIGARISLGDLRRYVPIYSQGAVYHDLLVKGARNLTDYLQSQGYFDSKVDFSEQKRNPDEIEILYSISLGRSQKLEYIGIEGNRYFSTHTIRERMLMQPAGLFTHRHGRYSQALLRQDVTSIETLYRSNGFRSVEVSPLILRNYRQKEGQVAVIIRIHEGPQWRVASLEVEGIHQLDPNLILPKLASIKGEPFSETNVAIDRDLILREYQDHGFADAAFDWSYQPLPGTDRVDVRYEIKEGEQRFVRDVLIEGLQTTRPELVQENLAIHPGDPLALTKVAETQQRLYQLGIFSSVNQAIQNPEGDTRHKYLQYVIEEGRKYTLSGGVGAEVARIGGSQTSLEAPGGQTGFSPRLALDLSRLNFRGVDQSLTFNSRLSSFDKLAAVNYLIPHYRKHNSLDLTSSLLYDDYNNIRTFAAKRLEGSMQLLQRLSRPTTMIYRFSYRRVSIDAATLKISPLLIPLVAQPARVGMLSGNLVQDRRDDPVNAHKGIYNSLDTGLSWRGFGSQKNFMRILGRNATYSPFGSLVLARRVTFGWLPVLTGQEKNSLSSIPFAERFFGGGASSDRAFPENQAGPRDPMTGFPIGGRALLFFNTELRFPMVGKFGGVLFYDAGNIYSTLGDVSFRVHQKNLTDFNYMVHALGFGLRYETPIGPLRLDLAYSINPPQFYGLKGTVDQLLFGGATRVLQSISHFQFFFSVGQAF